MVLVAGSKIARPNFEAIPEELKTHHKWLLWKADLQEGGTLGKVPYQLNGFRASKSNPKHYRTFEEVKIAYKKGGFDGIGIVINSDDDLICIDLDGFEDMNNIPNDKFNLTIYSYTEISPSHTGLHVWVKGQKPSGVGTKQNGIEFYGDSNAFLTVTGNPFNSEPVREHQKLIDHIANKYFPQKKKPISITGGRPASTVDDIDDNKLINIMFKSKNGQSIKRLFEGDTSKYNGDHSSADQALCNHLAFYTAKNTERIDRLFRQSGLYRDKWDRKTGASTYGAMTIQEAIDKTTNIYSLPKLIKQFNNNGGQSYGK